MWTIIGTARNHAVCWIQPRQDQSRRSFSVQSRVINPEHSESHFPTFLYCGQAGLPRRALGLLARGNLQTARSTRNKWKLLAGIQASSSATDFPTRRTSASRMEYNLVRHYLVSSFAMVTWRGTNQICLRLAILYTWRQWNHTQRNQYTKIPVSSMETSSLDGINTSLNHKSDNFGEIKFVNLTPRSV